MNFNQELAYQLLSPHFQERLRQQELLAAHSAFGVGGLADIWLALETLQELEMVVRLCKEQQWPLLITGAGRNSIFSDRGVRGIVARMDLQGYTIEPHMDGTATLIADAGVRWSPLFKELIPLGWAGLEFGIAIPGTLGAGVVSNVGAHHQALGQVLEWIEVLDTRTHQETQEGLLALTRRRYLQEDLDLGNRHSRFRVNRYTHLDSEGHLVFPVRHLIEPEEIIVKLGLRLRREVPQDLGNRSQQYLRDRRVNEPLLPKTGPIFKDPPGWQAHDLITQTGLAGKTIDHLQISEQNANYITNLGGATASALVSLITQIHQQVRARSGIDLVLNVDLLGEWTGQTCHV